MRPGRRAFAALALAAGLAACAEGGPAPAAPLVISLPYEVDTLDPHARNTLSNFAVVSHLYEPLVTTDPDMKIRPGLARSWENPDPSTWIFHLRPGVRFHSGRPLRAADAAFSLARLRADARLEMAGYVLYIQEATALDELTLRVRTTQPLSVLLNKLRFVPVVPEGSDAADLAARPDGTGPYTLAEWQRGVLVRLQSNPAYWGAAPPFAQVQLRLGRSPEQAAEDVRAGRARLAQCNSKRVAGETARAADLRLVRQPSLFLKFLGFDVLREASPHVVAPRNPFRDLRVREAVHLGLDRARLVDDLPTDAVPANQLVPPVIFGFNPALPAPAHDPDRARALLRAAGFPEGFRADLHVRRIYEGAGRLVADQLRPLGIRLEVSVLPDPEFLDRMRRRETSLYLSRFGAPTGDASDILDNALHSTDTARQMGMQNYGGYSSPEVDHMIEASAGIDSVSRRREALEAVTARIMADLPWVPLFVDQDTYLVDRRLSWRPRSDSFVLAAEIGPR